MEMDLQIVVRKHGGVPVIELSGEVDAYTSARFREIMLETIDADNLGFSAEAKHTSIMRHRKPPLESVNKDFFSGESQVPS